ncbi:DUF58 domain-containing protein [Litchfieldia alkalitelluris]|uniref:DUF58 domain-containing protein n=1 Tax=Litchfieldia alkalitelluris TaxID=304268 RepID=UPI000997DA80|nr:DUF58 domain-containing protein [Litchfieldia alkalitelluris]
MSIPWLLFATVIVAFIQSIIFHKWGLTNIEYKRVFSQKTAFEGEEIEMIDQISNRKLLPVFWLRLESKINTTLKFDKKTQPNIEIHDEEFHRSFFSFLPYQRITRKQKVTCMKRGYFRFKTVSISTGDLLGFGETFKSLHAMAEIKIYPKILSMDEIPLPTHSWLGDLLVKRWIIDDPFVRSGIRDYTYGDSLSSVNWKSTARTGVLQVNKNDFSADHHLMIYLNFDQTEDIWRPINDKEVIEKGISYAATIGEYAISKGVSTGFGCNSYLIDDLTTSPIKESVRIHPSSGNQQTTQLFDTLAKLELDMTLSFHYFLDEDIENELKGTDILILTSIYTERMRERVEQLEALGNSVEILMLSTEDKIAEVGDVRC